MFNANTGSGCPSKYIRDLLSCWGIALFFMIGHYLLTQKQTWETKSGEKSQGQPVYQADLLTYVVCPERDTVIACCHGDHASTKSQAHPPLSVKATRKCELYITVSNPCSYFPPLLFLVSSIYCN